MLTKIHSLDWESDGILDELKTLQDHSIFTDVTLICEDGNAVEAHQVVLTRHSTFLRDLFREGQCCLCQGTQCHFRPERIVIFLPDISTETMEGILQLLYLGKFDFSGTQEADNLKSGLKLLQINIPATVSAALDKIPLPISEKTIIPLIVKKKQSLTKIPCGGCGKTFRYNAALAAHLNKTNCARIIVTPESPGPDVIVDDEVGDDDDVTDIGSFLQCNINEDDGDDDYEPMAVDMPEDLRPAQAAIEAAMSLQRMQQDDPDYGYRAASVKGEDCPICKKFYPNSKKREHFASSHYSNALKKYVQTVKPGVHICSLCGKTGKVLKQIGRHAGLLHNKIEDVVLPEHKYFLKTSHKRLANGTPKGTPKVSKKSAIQTDSVTAPAPAKTLEADSVTAAAPTPDKTDSVTAASPSPAKTPEEEPDIQEVEEVHEVPKPDEEPPKTNDIEMIQSNGTPVDPLLVI